MIRINCPTGVLSLALLVLHLLSANACHKAVEKEKVKFQTPSELLPVLAAFKNHVEGVSILNPDQIEAYKLFIDAQKKNLGSDKMTIRACFDLVESYDKSLVPASKKAFQDFAFNYWGKKPSTTDPDNYLTLRDHEKLWDTYDETYADLIKRNVQEIIDRYFPNGKP